MTKVERLAEIEGFNDWMEMLVEYGMESVVPGICSNPHCEYTARVEPDCADGYCEECHSQSVKSFMVLSGLI